MTLTNWAGNVTFGAARVHRPTTVAQVQELLAAGGRARALGSGHSFSPVADTTGDLISVAGLPARRALAADRSAATVSAGLRYGEIAPWLHAEGLALHNLGSLPHISVGGAVATGTHGSGTALGCLASAVTGLELVTPAGDLLQLTREDERFAGAVVALGCLGVVTAVTLRVEPSYDVRQTVYDDLPYDVLSNRLDEVLTAGTSVSVFSTWQPDDVVQVWVKQRVDRPSEAGTLGPRWLGARAATGNVNPVPGMPPEHATPQLGVPGPWHERLPHFRLDHTPSSGNELQSEYLVPREHSLAALDVVHALRERVAPVLQVSELRTVAADDLWLSPAYGRDSFAVHFTWVDDADAVRPVVATLEERLAPLQPRPHWGKVFTTAPDDVASLYPRLPDFQRLRSDLDPGNRLGNPMVDRYLG